MTLSPKKFASNYTNCTAQRGVEAKDVEFANAHLDVTTSNSSPCRAESSAEREPSSARPEPPDDAASYLQVVVEKHRRRREVAAAQTSPRLPSASSPLAHGPTHIHQRGGHGGGDRGVFVLPHPVLLACPTAEPLCQALQAHNYYTRGALVDAATCARSAASLAPRDDAPAAHGAGDAPDLTDDAQKKSKSWKIFRDLSSDYLQDNEPERVEVYYFEQGAGAWLATCDVGREAWCERAARRPARAARALLAEALSVPALLLTAPLTVILAAQRTILVLIRGAVTGAVQTMSDYALKPALTLTFNALLQPFLVFSANVSRGIRAALRPLAAAVGDAVEPAVRLLSAVRLVDVHLACPNCTHNHGALV